MQSRREFLKKLAGALGAATTAPLEGAANVVCAIATSPSMTLVERLKEICDELETQFVINEELKARFGIRTDDQQLSSDSILTPDEDRITTYQKAREIMQGDARFADLAKASGQQALDLVGELSGEINRARSTLFKEYLGHLETLETQVKELSRGIFCVGPTDFKSEKGFVEECIRELANSSFWPDFIAVARAPSAAAMRGFIKNHFGWMYSNERREALEILAKRFNIALDGWGRDAAEQAQHRQEMEEQAQRQEEYHREVAEQQKKAGARVIFMEGYTGSPIEGGATITGKTSLYPLYDVLAEARGLDPISHPSLSEDGLKIDIVNPSREQMKLLTLLPSQSHAERVESCTARGGARTMP